MPRKQPSKALAHRSVRTRTVSELLRPFYCKLSKDELNHIGARYTEIQIVEAAIEVWEGDRDKFSPAEFLRSLAKSLVGRVDLMEIRSKQGNRLCLDPLYRTDLRFYHDQSVTRFFDWLGRQGGSYVLSLNGKGKGLREVHVPETLYDERLSAGGDTERVYVRRAADGSSSHLRS